MLHQALFKHFEVSSKINKLIDVGDNVKKSIAATPVGKPIIEQLDLVIDSTYELAQSTRKIIALEKRRIKPSHD